jgi:NAD(P)-dependent dehydrogenase (short-subunit alcohol dehydrogenase family)
MEGHDNRNVALVTGAGSGIGRAVSIALAGAGFSVILAGRRIARLQEVASEAGKSCTPIAADVTDESQIAALFAAIHSRFGRLDLLFNNAGTAAPPTAFEDVPASQWRGLIDTNLTGAFLCAQAAYRMMQQQKPMGGRIINNGSISASVPRPHMVGYTASKHAITGLTKAISLEGRSYNIACGQIDIGNTATALASAIGKGTLQADLSLKAEPMFDVKHVADAVLYMAKLPLEANVQFMTVMATAMPYVGRG